MLGFATRYLNNDTYHEVKGAPRYLEGHRPETMAYLADWIRARFPSR